ncbi:DUF6257 family protein [Streptomyces ureilyticus]|uniref:EF-hand domain-containing protein n=1 Tax=Streptomyces ureilyticus TaxID=1775131 RepID=A0ABX0DU27_9ACTN|nr:DUF6257 family protein [Streptomyces ureilyticus]NGO43778.1 hypothetical protein [Streptomyces ureilyticus]
MSDDLEFSDFTTLEKVRIAALVGRMSKRGLADRDGSGRIDLSDLQRKVTRIEQQALRRKKRGTK